MGNFIVSIVGGAALGATYALISLGLVLVFRATWTFNFAHGQFMLIPALVVAVLAGSGSMPFGLTVLAALALIVAISVAFYLTILRRTVGMPHFMAMIATFGLAAILDGLISIVFGARERSIEFPGLPAGVVTIAGTRISSASLAITAIAFVLATVVVVVMRWTYLGTVIRAAGHDPALAAQGGIHVKYVYVGSWALAAILAGVAGILYGSTQVVNTGMLAVGMAAFPAILLGGIDSVEGAVVGGICIGILQGFTATYLGGQYVNLTTYGALLAVLMVYPQGLFGTRMVRRL
ncbi:branched-chain amino acid ABC transporter permease [Nocardia neocaledoniensis]|uniref:branched-chain amino acid ABC transporter permease n=1 Tax=Nocardia neocaledoniensis TaxID=236511 RepID=UPI002456A4D0|nr:branched-chain amino acid ABC transporter permease [Nocardia neocaledoniensis]